MTVISSLENTSLCVIVGTALLLSSSPMTCNSHGSLCSATFADAAKSKSDEDEGLIETKPCMEFSSPEVTGPASSTMGSCQNNACDDGCCRYHTAFLTCDQENDYTHQACICNDITNNTHIEDKTGDDSGVIDVGQNSTSAPIIIDGDDDSESTCDGGSVWWSILNETAPEHKTCTNSTGCDGVTMNGNQVTCCKRQFCWCDVFVDAGGLRLMKEGLQPYSTGDGNYCFRFSVCSQIYRAKV